MLRKWRFADSPIEVKKTFLPSLEGKEYLAQQKLDGWCTFLVRDDEDWLKTNSIKATNRGSNHYFISRREFAKGGPTDIPVDQKIVDKIIDKLHLPNLTVLICEWMKRRTQDTSIGEKLFVHDMLYINGDWTGNIGAMERWQKVLEISNNDFLPAPSWAKENFTAFFDKQASIPWTEGIVLKKMSSPIKGNYQKTIDSGFLIKCKWRSGSSGRDIVT